MTIDTAYWVQLSNFQQKIAFHTYHGDVKEFTVICTKSGGILFAIMSINIKNYITWENKSSWSIMKAWVNDGFTCDTTFKYSNVTYI